MTFERNRWPLETIDELPKRNGEAAEEMFEAERPDPGDTRQQNDPEEGRSGLVAAATGGKGRGDGEMERGGREWRGGVVPPSASCPSMDRPRLVMGPQPPAASRCAPSQSQDRTGAGKEPPLKAGD